MRGLIILLGIFLIAQSINGQVREEGGIGPRLKGHVKQIIYYTYHNNNEQLSLDSLKHPEKKIQNFDKDGLELDVIISDPSDDLALASKIIFDNTVPGKATGNVYTGNNELLSRLTFTYNSKNDVLEEDIYTLRGLSSVPPTWDFKATYKYDNRGNLMEKDEYQQEERAKPYQITSYAYDEKKQLVSMNEVEYSAKGVKKRNNVVKNSSDGSEQKFLTYDSNNKLTSEATVSYSNVDEQGNWRLSIDDSWKETKLNGKVRFRTITRREIVYFE